MSARKTAAFPAGFLKTLPIEQGATYAFSSCAEGKSGFLFMHTQPRAGLSAQEAVAALLRSDLEKAAELLEFQVQVDNVRGGGVESRLLHTVGSRYTALPAEDSAKALFEQFPVLALPCADESPEAAKFDELQAAVTQGLALKAGKASQEFASREAGYARFKELTDRGLAVRTPVSGRRVVDPSGNDEEVVIWVSPERSLEVRLAGAPGKPWTLTVDAVDDRAAAAAKAKPKR